MPRIYKETLQFNNNNTKKTPNYLIKTWSKHLNRHFSKEDIQVAN